MSNKHIIVRKPQSGSLSQQKKQNQSPIKKNDRFFRKPTTTTNLPFCPRSPMKVVKNQSTTANKEKEKLCNRTNSYENIQNKEDNLKNEYEKQVSLSNKDSNRKEQEEATIFTFLKSQQEEQQKQIILQQQSLSSGNTSEQYSVINEEDQFLTSFNQRFMNKEKDNVEVDSKDIKQEKFKQQSHTERMDQQQETNKKENNQQSSNKTQQNKIIAKSSQQNNKNEQNNLQEQKVNQTNGNMIKSSFPKQSDLSLIDQHKQHVYQSLSYQVSLSSQSHQQSDYIELSYSNSNNQVSTLKVSLSSKLVKIPQQPSSEEQSILLPPNHQFNEKQQQQLQKYQSIQKNKLKQKSKNENILLQDQSQGKPPQILNHQQSHQKQINPNNIEFATNNKIIDSFGVNLSQQQSSINDSKNSIFQQSHKQERRMQISQVKEYIVQQQRIIQQSGSIQSHYNRDKYYSYYQDQDQHYSLQHQSQQKFNNHDSSIETSQSTYTITQPEDCSYQYQQNPSISHYQKSPLKNNKVGEHSNFYHHFSNQGYQSSSQSQDVKKYYQTNQRKNNNKKINKIYQKKHQVKQSQSIKSKNLLINKKPDQFYDLHMNKLDGLIVQILQMKKDFQLHYLNTIRAQTKQCQNNNTIIMRQLRDIQNKLNNNNQQKHSKNNRTHKRSNSKAKQLIKYKEQKQNKSYVEDQSEPHIDYQEDYNYLQSSIAKVIKAGNVNNFHQNYHKLKSNNFQNTFVNQNLYRKQRRNTFKNENKQYKNKNDKNHYEKQNLSNQSINQPILPQPHKQLSQNLTLNNKFLQLKGPLKFTLKPKRIRKNFNNHNNDRQFLQKQDQYQNQGHKQQQQQIIDRQIQYYIFQNENKINQSQQQYGWQDRKESTLSDNTSVYSSNKQIDIGKNQENKMLNSLPYVSKVVSNKKQLKNAIKIVKKVYKSLLDQQMNEQTIKQNQLVNEQSIQKLVNEQSIQNMKVSQNVDSNININDNSHYSKSLQQSHTQVQQQQFSSNNTNKYCSNDNKYVQTVPYDDYEVYKQCENKQVHYLTDGFLTEFERQTIYQNDNKEQNTLQIRDQPQIPYENNLIDCNIVDASYTLLESIGNNKGIEYCLHISNQVKQKQVKQIIQLKQSKQSKCLITQPQTINSQNQQSHQLQNLIQRSTNQLQTNQQLIDKKQFQQLSINVNDKYLNVNQSYQNSSTFTHSYVKQPAILNSKQPITPISFNKKLKQGKYTRGQTKSILLKKQQNFKALENQTYLNQQNQQNYHYNYSKCYNQSNKQQSSNFNFNDSSIQILPDCPIFDSIYYQRHDKQLYKYKWFKFK